MIRPFPPWPASAIELRARSRSFRLRSGSCVSDGGGVKAPPNRRLQAAETPRDRPSSIGILGSPMTRRPGLGWCIMTGLPRAVGDARGGAPKRDARPRSDEDHDAAEAAGIL